MNAAALICAVHAAGGRISLLGEGDLLIRAALPLPEDLRAALRLHKPVIVARLKKHSLSSANAASSAANDLMTRSVLMPAVEPGAWSAGIPDPAARGIGMMLTAVSARGIPDKPWRTIVADTLAHVDNGLLVKAFSLGWTAADLFGCDRIAPWYRLDRAGLILLTNASDISSLTEDVASLRHQDGVVTRFMRAHAPPSPPVVMLWDLIPQPRRHGAKARHNSNSTANGG